MGEVMARESLARSLNHVGLAVPDLEAALAWYQEVLGFALLTTPVEMSADDAQLGDALASMLGPRVRRFRIAHLTMGNGVGLQLFQFIDPQPLPAEGSVFWRTGFSHICITDPDIEELSDQIARRGGRRSPVFRSIPGRPYAAAYCSDPWGNSIEINSHEYEETRSFLSRDP